MYDSERVATMYMDAKEFVIGAGYDAEVDWQSDVELEWATERDFLREAAWVVLSTGFRSAVVERRFARVSEAFLNWRDAEEIDARREQCRQAALAVFRNRRKIEAIVGIVSVVAERGIGTVKRAIVMHGPRYLEELPFVGPVTCYHLAKNLGLRVVKPDRHLVRMAAMAGCRTPDEMCVSIGSRVDESPAVVDLVLWRYATLTKDYGVFGNQSLRGTTREGK